MLTTIEGWMTAQVFIKLSSKLAAEQGVVDGLDGSMDFGYGASSNAVDPEDALSHAVDKPYLSRSTSRASSAQKKLRSGSREKSKKKTGSSSTSSIM